MKLAPASLCLLLALGATPLSSDPPAPAPGAQPPAPPAGSPPAPTEEERKREEAKRRQELEQRKVDLPPTAKPALALLEDFTRRDLRLWTIPLQRVVALGADAVPALLVMLEETDWEVRAFSAACLEALHPPDAPTPKSANDLLRPLVDALAKETMFTEARRRIVKALAALRQPEAAPALAGAAKDADAGIVLAAVRGLGMLGSKEAIPELRTHARNADPDVRYDALGSLGALGDAVTLHKLLEEAQALVAGDARRSISRDAFDLGDRYRQYLLGVALARCWDPAADELLGDVLEAKKPWERKTFLRLGGAEGLGRRAAQKGPAAARVPAMHKKLVDGLGHDDATVRVACSYGLRFTGTEELVRPLTRALSDSQLDVRCNVVRALGNVGSEAAVKALKKALHDRAAEVRVAVVRAVADVAGEGSTDILIEGLRDEKYVVRVLAGRGLGRRPGESGVVEALAKAANDGDYGVRAQALASLAQASTRREVALPVVAAGLKDADEGVQANACLGLATLILPGTESPTFDEIVVRRVVTLALESPSVRLQRAAEELLDSQRPATAMAPLLAALASEKVEVRRRANVVLQLLSESNQAFRADGPPPEREAGLAKWRAWWEKAGRLPPRERRTGLVFTGPLAEQARDLKWRGLDVALLLDSTGSMAGLLRSAKQGIDDMLAELGSPLPSLRISLFTYRDFGDDYVYYGTPLTFDMERLPGFLQSFVHGQGGDIPEAVHDTVTGVMKELNWRKDANKVIIFAGDAPHHPEQDAEFTREIKAWATPANRAVLHAIFTDTNRRSMDIARRKEREAPDDFKHPYLDIYTRVSFEGRGKAVLLSDESTLIKEILVLAFGPAWRADIENFLDFRT